MKRKDPPCRIQSELSSVNSGGDPFSFAEGRCGGKTKRAVPRDRDGPLYAYSWRRPTFPRSYPRSIIGPAELNFRVRDGNGCFPRGMATRKLRPWRVTNHSNGRAKLNEAGAASSGSWLVIASQVVRRRRTARRDNGNRFCSRADRRSAGGALLHLPLAPGTTHRESFMVKPNGRLVRVSFIRHRTSTSRLSRR